MASRTSRLPRRHHAATKHTREPVNIQRTGPFRCGGSRRQRDQRDRRGPLRKLATSYGQSAHPRRGVCPQCCHVRSRINVPDLYTRIHRLYFRAPGKVSPIWHIGVVAHSVMVMASLFPSPNILIRFIPPVLQTTVTAPPLHFQWNVYGILKVPDPSGRNSASKLRSGYR